MSFAAGEPSVPVRASAGPDAQLDAAAAGPMFGAVPPDISALDGELSQHLAQLMAELSHGTPPLAL